MKKVLFVCTGNTCRSPMAEALLKARVGDQLEVKSAGVHAFSGSPASEGTTMVLAEKDIEFDHQSQMVTEELLQWADIVLTMTKDHQEMIQLLFPESCEHISTFKEFVDPKTSDHNIADPFGSTVEAYRKVAQEIEGYLDTLINKLVD